MEHATQRSARTRKGAGRVSKLFRVLVAGGIALAGCVSTKTAEKPDKPDDQAAGARPASQPEQPGGVRGW